MLLLQLSLLVLAYKQFDLLLELHLQEVLLVRAVLN